MLKHQLPTAFDVDGIEVNAVMSPNVFAGGTTQQCVLLGTFEAREGMQGTFAEQRSPGGQRQTRGPQTEAGRVTPLDPLTLGENTVHERVVKTGHDALRNPKPEQELSQRRPVNLGAKPEDPDNTTQDSGARLDDDIRVGIQGDPTKQCERHEGQHPREGRLNPSASTGMCEQQKHRADP